MSDLTYVRVEQKWYYICVLIDLYNREIIGHSAGPNKDAALVHRAFSTVRYNLHELEMFHTDREKEFDNKLINEVLETFNIKRSLSDKGSPYDNAVAEATFKSIKTEFVYGSVFSCQQELDLELFDYVNWFNNIRIHGSLNYQSPVEYKETNLLKVVQFSVDIPLFSVFMKDLHLFISISNFLYTSSNGLNILKSDSKLKVKNPNFKFGFAIPKASAGLSFTSHYILKKENSG